MHIDAQSKTQNEWDTEEFKMHEDVFRVYEGGGNET